jgi:hypothetical protein
MNSHDFDFLNKYNFKNYSKDYYDFIINLITTLSSVVKNENKSKQDILNEIQDLLMENEIKMNEAISNITMLNIKAQLLNYSKIKKDDPKKYEEEFKRKNPEINKKAELYANEIKNINDELDKLNFD